MTIGTAAGLAVLSVASYLVVFYLFKMLFKKGSLTHYLISHLRLPTLVLFLEIAAYIALQLFNHDQKFQNLVRHVFSIVIIGSVAWTVIAMLKAIYRYLLERHNGAGLADFSRRSTLTQALLIYQTCVFLTILLAVAFILMTFPQIRSIGVGILGSAGIAGIALGLAARPILLNLMAGFQIAFTKTIKLEDTLQIEGEFVFVEAIRLTHVVARTWDLRRMILPISYFIDKPFQNWSKSSTELIGTVFLYCDYTVPVDLLRSKFDEILKSSPLWNGKVTNLVVHDTNQQTMQVRMILSANSPSETYNLRCFVREKMIDFIQSEYPSALPRIRYENLTER